MLFTMVFPFFPMFHDAGRIDWPLAETLAIGSLILRFNPERHEDELLEQRGNWRGMGQFTLW